MIIRKLFKMNGMHIVRNCSSDRCKKSLHSHNYTVEIKLKANVVDNGQMVVDFGLLKGTMGLVVKCFDQSYSMWDRETIEFKHFIDKNFSRYVIMPASPSAEMYSLMFYAICKEILNHTEFQNGESPKLHSVMVHETITGYAESFEEDYQNIWLPNYKLKDIIFSEGIIEEWKDKEFWNKLLNSNEKFIKNPIVKLTH